MSTKDMPEAETSPATEPATEMQMRFEGEYPLQKAVDFEGKRYDKLNYDLKALSATDILKCRATASRMREGSGYDTLMGDDLLHVIAFLRSANLPVEFLDVMGGADYTALATIAQLFFARAASAAVR